MSVNERLKETLSRSVITRITPTEFIKSGNDEYFIDFGKDAFGTLELNLEVDSAAKIEICLGEVLDSSGKLFEPEPQSKECSRRFRRIYLELKPGRHTYKIELPVPCKGDNYQQKGYNCTALLSCPEISGEIMPFRYCFIKGSCGNFQKTDVVQLMVHAPFDDDAAKFTSSNENLNKVWEFCKHTIKATTCFGIYVDGDRERLPYAGDAFVNQLSHFSLDTNYEVSANTIDWFCEKGTAWCYEFPMLVPVMAWNHYLYSGDKSLLERNYEQLKVMTLSLLAREDGLIVTEDDLSNHKVVEIIKPREGRFRNLVDWPRNMRDDYEIGSVNTSANSFHVSSLRAIAGIAEAVGKAEESKTFAEKAAAVCRAMEKSLLDKETKLFIDNIDSSHSSIHASIQPLFHNVVDYSKRPEQVSFIKSKGMACSVWASQFLLESLCRCGEEEYTLSLMTGEGERSWINMLKNGATMTMEAWSNEMKPNQDWNHPWATSPLNIIVRYIMGIIPQAPGCRKVSIFPRPAGLDFAELTFPTIKGQVKVSFEKQAGDYNTNIDLPEGIEQSSC
ncbi:MAG: alpha-L-rhamnosidase-related protein [Planctomycetota bacterium]|jgi:hypothetical protein